MPEIMIKCPKTKKEVCTGMKMDKADFETSTLPDNNMIMHCPHCGENHTWGKEEAYLVDSE
jgi:predicted  nucleic acid-binding Zn-ribbon protein